MNNFLDLGGFEFGLRFIDRYVGMHFSLYGVNEDFIVVRKQKLKKLWQEEGGGGGVQVFSF